MAAVRAVKQFLTFVGSGPFQPAVARALALPDEFYAGVRADLLRKRDLLADGLAAAGLSVNRPDGTYFVTADAAPRGYPDAMELCWELPRLVGVVGVPVQVFHDDPQAAPSLLRFAFCKQDGVLAEAAERLAGLPARTGGRSRQ